MNLAQLRDQRPAPFRAPTYVLAERHKQWRAFLAPSWSKLLRLQGNTRWKSLGAPAAAPPPGTRFSTPDDPDWPMTPGPHQVPIAAATHTWTAADWRAARDWCDLRPERFALLGWHFDVLKAKRLANRLRLPVRHEIPGDHWWPRGRERIRIDEAHAREVKRDRPVLFVEVAMVDGLERWLVDGNHRAVGALACTPRPHLPTVTVPAAHAAQCIVSRTARTAHYRNLRRLGRQPRI